MTDTPQTVTLPSGLVVPSRHINQSQLKAWRRCQLSWKYKYQDGLSLKTTERPLFLGSWVHACLETHYKNGDWKIGYQKYLKIWNGLFEEERIMMRTKRKKLGPDLADVVRAIMRSYLWYYRAEVWKPILVEWTFEVVLNGITFKGTIDYAGEDENGDVWMWDHKTAASIPEATAYHSMDPQLMLYPWAASKVLGIQIKGIIWNYVRSRPAGIPQITRSGALSRRAIVTDYPTAVRALRSYGLDPADYSQWLRPMSKRSPLLRRYRLPREDHVLKQILREAVVTARDIHTPRQTYVRSITPDCVRCSYMMLCRSDLEGGDTQFLANKYYKHEEDPDLGESTDSEFDEADSDEDGEGE